MTSFLYRLQKEEYDKLESTQRIEVDFIPPDCANAKDGDSIIVYVSQTLDVLGIYTLQSYTLICEKKIKNKTLRDIWQHFSFVHTVTDTTSRLFKKKMRELTHDEFEKVKNEL